MGECVFPHPACSRTLLFRREVATGVMLPGVYHNHQVALATGKTYGDLQNGKRSMPHVLGFGSGLQAICCNKQMSFCGRRGMMPRESVRTCRKPNDACSYECMSCAAKHALRNTSSTEKEAIKSMVLPRLSVFVLIVPFLVDMFPRVFGRLTLLSWLREIDVAVLLPPMGPMGISCS